MIIRICFSVCFILSLIFLPWYLTILYVLTVSVYIPRYYESILFGFITDVYYGQHTGVVRFIYTLSTSVLFFLIMYIRSRIRVQ